MSITHITPREQKLLEEAECMRTQIEFWKSQALNLGVKLTRLEEQLDEMRRIVLELDRRVLKGRV